MEFLEDILVRYGVIADYWRGADDRPSGDAGKSVLSSGEALGASKDWRNEVGTWTDRPDLERLPMLVAVADLRVEAGNSEAALAAYEAAVSNEEDLGRLCELGYLLLQRCGIEELPLSDNDFDGIAVSIGEEPFLVLSSRAIDITSPGPSFPDRSALLNLAVLAFGRAYVRSVRPILMGERGSSEDRWYELLALEGCRAAFLHCDDLDAVDAVRFSYYGWLEEYREGTWGLSARARVVAKSEGYSGSIRGTVDDYPWPPDDPINPFRHMLFDTEAYLRVRRTIVPGQGSEERRYRELQNSLRDDLLGELKEIRRLGEATHDRLDLLVDRLIDLDQRSESTWGQIQEFTRSSPDQDKRQVRARLEEDLGQTWEKLQEATREDLIDADLISAECRKIGSAWRCAAIGYGTAVERELRKTGRHLKERVFGFPGERRETLGDLIRDLDDLAGMGSRQLPDSARMLLEATRELWVLNDIRTKAAHPRKVAEADLVTFRDQLIQTGERSRSLLELIVRARDAD